MKRITFISLAIITVLAWSFIGIGIASLMNSCDQPKTETKESPDSQDSIVTPSWKTGLDAIYEEKIDSLKTEINAWTNIVSINHVNLERQQESMRDLAAELDAEREQKEKFMNRLDSAISIIRRQEVQLKNCIYSKP